LEDLKGELLYEGKAKKIYKTEEDSHLRVKFKDDLTAFNGQKKASIIGKGVLNHKITSLIFQYLEKKGHPTHWVRDLKETEMLCLRVEIIPLEVVVRNQLAGSTAKKFGLEEGTSLKHPPLIEFFYKKDELGDPFVSEDQILALEIVQEKSLLEDLKKQAHQINQSLQPLFQEAGIDLVDYKLEFGISEKKELVLADEITPDSCRLWDHETKKRLDKDRFRKDLGQVLEGYEEVYNRLKAVWLRRE